MENISEIVFPANLDFEGHHPKTTKVLELGVEKFGSQAEVGKRLVPECSQKTVSKTMSEKKTLPVKNIQNLMNTLCPKISGEFHFYNIVKRYQLQIEDDDIKELVKNYLQRQVDQKIDYDTLWEVECQQKINQKRSELEELRRSKEEAVLLVQKRAEILRELFEQNDRKNQAHSEEKEKVGAERAQIIAENPGWENYPDNTKEKLLQFSPLPEEPELQYISELIDAENELSGFDYEGFFPNGLPESIEEIDHFEKESFTNIESEYAQKIATIEDDIDQIREDEQEKFYDGHMPDYTIIKSLNGDFFIHKYEIKKSLKGLFPHKQLLSISEDDSLSAALKRAEGLFDVVYRGMCPQTTYEEVVIRGKRLLSFEILEGFNLDGGHVHIYERPNYQFYAVYQTPLDDSYNSYLSDSFSANDLVENIRTYLRHHHDGIEENRSRALIFINEWAEKKREQIQQIEFLNTDKNNSGFWSQLFPDENYLQEDKTVLCEKFVDFLFELVNIDGFHCSYLNNSYENLVSSDFHYDEVELKVCFDQFWEPELHSALKENIIELALEALEKIVAKEIETINKQSQVYPEDEEKIIIDKVRQVLAENGYSVDGIKMV